MQDIFETTIVCDQCNQKTSKAYAIKDGFKLRVWNCDNCKKTWYHPTDIQEYDGFKKLRDKTFQVKLRIVGNSYTISIPKEIIDFEEELQEINKILYLSLEEPEKLSIFFRKELRKFIK